MITGRKAAHPQDAIRSAWRSVAALMLVAVLGFWWPAVAKARRWPAPAWQSARGRRRAGHDDD